MKEKFRNLRAELLADLTCEAYQLTHNPTKGQAIGAGAYAGAAALMGMSNFAAAETLSQKVNDLMKEAYGWIVGIVSGLAIVLLAFCGIKYMSASDPKEAAGAKDWMKRIILCWILICLLPLISGVIQDFTDRDGLKKDW